MKLAIKKKEQLKLPAVYRKSAHGGILFSQIEVHPTLPQYRTYTGVMGGKVKVSAWTDCSAKNEGKANARTPREQAFAQAEMKRQKLLRKGQYHESVETIDQPTYFLPMLAATYKKSQPPIFPIILQPKLNGGRCIVDNTEMRSRYGDLFVSCPHIFKELSFFYKNGTIPKTLRLDGELYNHKWRYRLNRLMSVLRKKKLNEAQLAFSKANAQFHIYDCYDSARPDLTLKQRRKIISDLFVAIAAFSTTTSLKKVPSLTVANEIFLETEYARLLSMGYEGGMLRPHFIVKKKKEGPVPTVYEPGARSKTLLKYKPTFTDEYRIIEILDGNGKRRGRATKVVLRLPNGKTSKANIKWKEPEKIRLWQIRESLKGQLCTVRHSGLTEYGKPFHAYLEVIHGKTRTI